MTRAALVVALVAAISCAACRREAPANDAPANAETTARPAASATLRSPTSTGDAVVRDTRVLPNAFRGDDTLASLQARFGPSNVRVEEILGAEGEVERGIVLFPYDPARRAYLHFSDEQALEGLALVRIVDDESNWTLGDIRMGTTLAELVARNGAPIEFSGFGWDYGGAIAGFGGGALEPRDGAWPRTGFRLSPRESLGEDMLRLPQGDGTFASDDPKAAEFATDIVVGELTLAFPRPSGE